VPGPLSVAAGTEIHQHGPSTSLPHDVVRLDVAVDETGPMHGGERAAQVEADERRFPRADRPALHELLLEGAAGEKFHGDPDDAVVDIRPIDGDDVLMADPRHQPAFGDDAVPGNVAAGAAGDQFEGDLAIEPDVACAVDDAEAPLADLLEQLEAAPRAWRRGDGWRDE
jgi:hypothetical protein